MCLRGPARFAALGDPTDPEERASGTSRCVPCWGEDRVSVEPLLLPPLPFALRGVRGPTRSRSVGRGRSVCSRVLGSGQVYGDTRIPMPNPISPFRWEGASPIDLGARESEQSLWGLWVSFWANPPTDFTMAVESAFTMALTRSYTGLANDLARHIAGPVNAASSGQRMTLISQMSLRDRLTRELGLAPFETRSEFDAKALLTAARAILAATAAAPRAASPAPASTPRRGVGGGPSGR